MDEEKPLFQFEEKDPFYKRPAFLVFLVTLAFAVVLFLIFYKKDIQGSMRAEEVGQSMQVLSHRSIWVEKRVRPDETTLVPSFTFQIKNVGRRNVQYVSFQGVFIFEDSGENLSDGFAIALKKPLPPGEVSEEIFIRGSFGYSASSKQAFILNMKNWKRVKIKLYARVKNSRYVLLGIFPISQEIEGVVVHTTAPETPPPQPQK